MTPHDNANFLAGTTDCAHLAQFAVEDDIGSPDFIAAQLLNGQGVIAYKSVPAGSLIT